MTTGGQTGTDSHAREGGVAAGPVVVCGIAGEGGERTVYINGEELLPERSLRVANKSRDGFGWGYAGSAPSQLALAILLECGFGDDAAYLLMHDFKEDFLVAPPIDGNFLIAFEPAAWREDRIGAPRHSAILFI